MIKGKLLLTAAFAVLFAATVSAAETVKIGMNLPQTGIGAADGKSVLTAAQIAVDEINADGGINGKSVELVVYDDQTSPKFSVPVATKLIEKDQVPIGISGSYSGATRAAAGVFQAAGVPYISAYAVHPDITRAGDLVFRTSFVGEVLGRAGAHLVGKQLGKKRAVVTVMKNDYGKSLARGFKEVAAKFGIEIVNEYEYSLKDRQFGPIVSKVKADNPDVIYDTGYWFVAAPLVSQLRGGGVNAPVVGQEGYDGQKFIEIAGAASDGVMITTSLDRDSTVPKIKAFMSEFEKRAGYKADMVGASAHVAVNVAVAALRKAGSMDAKAIQAALQQTNYEGVTGKIRFNEIGEAYKVVQVQVVRDGGWHHHSVITDTELLTPPLN